MQLLKPTPGIQCTANYIIIKKVSLEFKFFLTKEKS